MAFKFVVLAVCLAAANAGFLQTPVAYNAGPVAVAKTVVDTEYDPNPQYTYSYGVQDSLTGDSKSQVESRNGDVVQGQYSLIDSDGTKRTVDYTADPINGFNAVVSKTPLVAKVHAPVVAAAPAVIAARVAAPAVAYSAPAVVAAKVAAPALAYSAAPGLAYSAGPAGYAYNNYAAAPVAYSAGYAAPAVSYSAGPAVVAAKVAGPAAYAYNNYAAAPVAYSAGYAGAPVAYSAGYASPLVKSYYH